jgi:hypothetical protein
LIFDQKVGNNIEAGMKIPEAPKSVVEMIFIYNVNGKNQEFTEADLMNIPEGATFVDRKDKVTEGYVNSIHDFTMMKTTLITNLNCYKNLNCLWPLVMILLC